MKKCYRCKLEKPTDEFYKCAGRKDGLQTKCKDCNREVFKAWRRSESGGDKHRAWSRARNATPEGRRRNTENVRRYRATDKGRITTKIHNLVWQANNAGKAETHRQFKNAKKRGEIVPQPCEKCGNPRAHGHHDDYARPLDVRWLCHLHHTEHHRSHT